MTKNEAAKFLAVSPKMIDVYVGEGKLHPQYDKDSTKLNASYDADEIAALKVGSQKNRARREYSDRVWRSLVCPSCNNSLERTADGAVCSNCKLLYGYTDFGILDLRLRRPKVYNIRYEVGPDAALDGDSSTSSAPSKLFDSIDNSGGYLPRKLNEWYANYWPTLEEARDGLVLDLGCGSIVRNEWKGNCEYLAVDYHSYHAHLLVDAHALPFKEDTFDFVFSSSLIEHLQYPLVAMREVLRAMKPGSKFIGGLSFLEPFHWNSFYHHTHLGITSTLQHAGFEVLSVVPSAEWSVLRAQFQMGYFADMPESMWKAILAVLEGAHRFYWRRAAQKSQNWNEGARIRNTTGAFTFAATKPASV